MSRREEKVLQYLNEAHAAEVALTRVLQSQILMTPKGRYRRLLESHLRETRDHAYRLERRMKELGQGRAPLQALVGLAESIAGQLLALGKTPIDLIRGTGGEEKVLKNAKDASATEALEIATYTAIERLADDADDEETARLARSIRSDEEKMLDRVLREIPRLTDAVAAAELNGSGSYEIADTGAAAAVRDAASAAREPAGAVELTARRTARQARKATGAARTGRQAKRITATAADVPLADYDKLTASEVAARLPELSQGDLAKVEAYERRHEKRATVLNRIGALKGQEPWPGYDELTASEIRAALEDADEELAKRVYEYERAHKNRSSVLEVAARERRRERTHA
jgi:ferritin-like metal-binding protein YciE